MLGGVPAFLPPHGRREMRVLFGRLMFVCLFVGGDVTRTGTRGGGGQGGRGDLDAGGAGANGGGRQPTPAP